MVKILILIVGILIGLLLAWFWFKNGNKIKRDKRRESLIRVNEMMRMEKEKAKQKVLDFLEGKEKVSNSEVEILLSVSDATATRYLEELEKEERIVQVGKTGRFVYYKII